jgi:putative transposase
MRKLIRKYRMAPSKFVTDRLPSYAAARAELPVTIAHERACERATEQKARTFRCDDGSERCSASGQPAWPQRFLSTHASVYNTFNICRQFITSAAKRRFRIEAFVAWRAAVGVAA